jgi:2-oxo-4-hydroxy-4-carboxy-5-ureidoimidazoline decarboxylase
MTAPHTILNHAADDELGALLRRCCGAERWVLGMRALRPFSSEGALLEAADAVWGVLDARDYLEAFSQHPRIGDDVAQLRARFGDTASLASAEQASVREADEAVLHALRDANEAYYARFGYIFIVCATGKSAPEMLALLRARLRNDPERELGVAAAEQAAITKLRLRKLGA